MRVVRPGRRTPQGGLKSVGPGAICRRFFMDGSERIGRLRWIHEDAEGMPVASSLPGAWLLYLWGTQTFLEPSR